MLRICRFLADMVSSVTLAAVLWKHYIVVRRNKVWTSVRVVVSAFWSVLLLYERMQFRVYAVDEPYMRHSIDPSSLPTNDKSERHKVVRRQTIIYYAPDIDIAHNVMNNFRRGLDTKQRPYVGMLLTNDVFVLRTSINPYLFDFTARLPSKFTYFFLHAFPPGCL